MLRLRKCENAEAIVRKIIGKLDVFQNLEKAEVSFVVSRGSRSRAYARIYGLPRAVQVGFGLRPLYTVEFMCERMNNLNTQEVLLVLLHELLHIPSKPTGGLRPHGRLVNNRRAGRLARLVDSGLGEKLREKIRECCGGF